MSSNRDARLKRLQYNLLEWKIDAALITSFENIRYISGFTGSSAVVIAAQNKVFFLTDSRYITQAHDEVEGFKIIEYKKQIDEVVSLLKKIKAKDIGFEGNNINYDYYKKLKNFLANRRIFSLTEKLNAIRIKKDAAEIEIIRQAAKIGAKGFDIAKRHIRDGAVERDVAIAMEFGMRKRGAEKPSFDIIVASGKSAALPHGRASTKKIKKGEAVVVDSGAVYKGYNSDETCTFFTGSPTRKQKEIYDIVKDAHDAAIDAVMPGVKASSIDAAARGIIKKAGYGKYFGHGTGHGIGLLVHEMPKISKFDNTMLEENMVFTIEPGIYMPEWGGVRIEDMVRVTKSGCEVLTRVSKEMTVL
ncbi:MAG: aminopeptidase P family protein [Deltaproteobacteria bacterium]|nr:aminopeptidase P family protein [Deltaproteobacteria bacterium]